MSAVCHGYGCDTTMLEDFWAELMLRVRLPARHASGTRKHPEFRDVDPPYERNSSTGMLRSGPCLEDFGTASAPSVRFVTVRSRSAQV